MPGVKLIVMYPVPLDIEEFEKVYHEEHVPMAQANLRGNIKIVGTKILGTPQPTRPFHRIAEVHFPTMQALEECARSEGGKRVLGHASSISSGGSPLILIADEKVMPSSQD
jgi:uncharacterized protein (TIGR02118 family)